MGADDPSGGGWVVGDGGVTVNEVQQLMKPSFDEQQDRPETVGEVEEQWDASVR